MVGLRVSNLGRCVPNWQTPRKYICVHFTQGIPDWFMEGSYWRSQTVDNMVKLKGEKKASPIQKEQLTTSKMLPRRQPGCVLLITRSWALWRLYLFIFLFLSLMTYRPAVFLQPNLLPFSTCWLGWWAWASEGAWNSTGVDLEMQRDGSQNQPFPTPLLPRCLYIQVPADLSWSNELLWNLVGRCFSSKKLLVCFAVVFFLNKSLLLIEEGEWMGEVLNMDF